MFCSNCGNKLDDNAKFCPNCGSPVGTVKRIKKDDHGIVLIGDNALAFSPKFYSNDEVASLHIKIVGKVIELRRSF